MMFLGCQPGVAHGAFEVPQMMVGIDDREVLIHPQRLAVCYGRGKVLPPRVWDILRARMDRSSPMVDRPARRICSLTPTTTSVLIDPFGIATGLATMLTPPMYSP